MIKECLVAFHGCDRYVAHSKIDDALRAFPRDGHRSWHSNLIQVGCDEFRGSIRTQNDAVVDALASAQWRELPEIETGKAREFLVELVPKKARQFSAFRDRVFAERYAVDRITAREAFAEFQCQYIAAGRIDIRKTACAYRAPSAWIRVTGRLRSPASADSLMLHGIGGSTAFGLGLLIPASSALYQLAKAVAGANTE